MPETKAPETGAVVETEDGRGRVIVFLVTVSGDTVSVRQGVVFREWWEWPRLMAQDLPGARE